MEAHYTTRIREDLERDGSTYVRTGGVISDSVARSRIRNAVGPFQAHRVRTEKDADCGIVGWLEA